MKKDPDAWSGQSILVVLRCTILNWIKPLFVLCLGSVAEVCLKPVFEADPLAQVELGFEPVGLLFFCVQN